MDSLAKQEEVDTLDAAGRGLQPSVPEELGVDLLLD